ncbi:MAG TPA: hypothetical protein VMB73_15450 [Acetobacteraceae bacterium]|nr:hypothetical protein [Acetobacteraceae bacterium]
MEDGSVVLGNIELKERTISLSVSSAARAERGKALLSAALTDLVAPPLTEIQTVEQMRAAARPADRQPTADIPPEVQAEMVHAMCRVAENHRKSARSRACCRLLSEFACARIPRIAAIPGIPSGMTCG